MTHTHHHKSGAGNYLSASQLLLAIGCIVVAFLLVFLAQSKPASLASAEAEFTDASASGLHIVPASCPSSPHYSGECSGSPPPAPRRGCTIFADPNPAVASEGTTLLWSTANWSAGAFVSSGVGPTPSNARIDPSVGAVNPAGSALVRPLQTTIYTLSGIYSFLGITFGSFSCSSTVYVNACPIGQYLENGECVVSACPVGYVMQNGACVFAGCPAGYVQQGTQCVASQCANICSGTNLVNNCTGAVVRTCRYGCVAGGCTVTPVPSIVTWNVRPVLVRSGETVAVDWAAQNVESCTVRGTNGDGSGTNATGLWDTTIGSKTSSPITEQTIFTITCQGFSDSSPASVARSTTVNVVPIFEEQ